VGQEYKKEKGKKRIRRGITGRSSRRYAREEN
jgi:hypothetical protein